MREMKLGALALIMATLVGCSGDPVKPDTGFDAGAVPPDSGQPLERDAMNGANSMPLEANDGLASSSFEAQPPQGLALPAERVFYFEFNEATPDNQDLEKIQAHGRFIASHPELQVRVDGHADERGSREYNIALGERRAQAVRKLLLLEGAHSDQLSVLSFGEEMPMVTGHEESSWRQNRRVELTYKTQMQ